MASARRSEIRRGWAQLAATLAMVQLAAWGTSIAASQPAASVPPPAPAATAAVDASSLNRKLMFGYQGWFGCPGDGSALDRWQHWFRSAEPAAETLRVDMWPDVSELPPAERCATSLTRPDGRPAELYSAHRAAVVDMHFRWLQEYELPGVFLQRFSAGLHDEPLREFRDTVARNVRTAAESRGRVFAVMYDITGHRGETLTADIKRDWIHVVDTLRLTDSGRYLRQGGRPLLALWGFGFTDRPASPAQAAELITFFKHNPDPRYRVTLLGGVPTGWRTLTRDSQADAAWSAVYRSFDILSPWAVGRFRDEAGMGRFYAEHVEGDLAETRRRGIEYMPVLFAGFSWHNSHPGEPMNQIPRRGGRFFWAQVERALQAGSGMLYAAMFDEVDEGTAMFKTAATRRDAPANPPTVTLDADGDPVPGDWYLRLAREAHLWLERAGRAPTGAALTK